MIAFPEARAQLASLMYHEVTDDHATTGFQRAAARGYTLGTRLFADHVDRLARAAIAPTLVDLVDFGAPGRHLALTFDDGGRSAMYVGELLAQRGWQGHFFIVTSRIGERTFLDAGGIRQLREMGHNIGSHSHTHPDIFRDLSRARMLEEWRVSALTLEDLLGEPCRVASVPGGDISAEVLESADDAGIRYLFTSEAWTTPRLIGRCWVLGRVCVKSGTTADQVGALIQFRGWRRARLERGLKDLARTSMAPLYRLYVERSTLPINRRGA